jgi:chromosome segregation ATPase
MAATTYMVEAPAPESTFSFFRRSSRKHSHHHHRRTVHHDAVDYVRVSTVEWDAVQKRERAFREANEAFARENESLKCSLRDSKADLSRLTTVQLPQLQSQVAQLTKANTKLRTDYNDTVVLANKHYHDAKQLRAKVDKLRVEKDAIEGDLRKLKRDFDRASRNCSNGSSSHDSEGHHSHSHSHRHGWRQRLDELRHALDGWKRRAEDSDKKCDEYLRKIARLETLLKDQEDTLETYEKILRRHGHVYG